MNQQQKYMRFKIIGLLIAICLLITLAVGYFLLRQNSPALNQPIDAITSEPAYKVIDFRNISADFMFLAQLPNQFKVEYLPNLKAIQIYDTSSGNNESMLYLSFFKADTFLTLKTVDISKATQKNITGHEAILYEITKKSTAVDFPGQPIWRNHTHKALDIRVNDGYSYFYSFAYNPKLPEATFNSIIESLILY